MEKPTVLKTLVSRSIVVITTVLLLSSCGIFKNKTTTRTKETNKEVLRVDSVKKESSEVSSGVKEVQKDINTKTTETTTKTTTKGGNSKVKVNKGDFDPDGTAEFKDSFGRKIVLSLDSLSKSLTIEIDAPEITEEKTTKITEQQDSSKEKETGTTNKSNSEATASKTEEKESTKNNTVKESKSSFWGIVGMYVGIALLIVIIIIAIKKFIL